MIESLQQIFKILHIPDLIGYVLTLIILFLVFLGGLYIRNFFDTSLHKSKLLNENNFRDKKSNSDEIKKILYEIENKIIKPIDNERIVFNPDKIDLDGLILKTEKTLYENTFNFGNSIKSPLSNIEKILISLNLKNRSNISEEERHQFFKENSIAKRILKNSSTDLKNYKKQIESELNKLKF